MKFYSTGTLLSHPKTKDRLQGNLNYWLVLHVDDDLGKYYLKLTQNALKARYTIIEPAWGSHISIIRNEIQISKSIFDELDNTPVKFEYDTEVYRVNRHFCMNAWCDEAIHIRKSLGLTPEPEVPFHLTIGVIPNI